MSRRPAFIVFMVLAVLLAACGSGGAASEPTAVPTAPASTSAPPATSAPAPTSAADVDWKQAVVRIVAAGSVVEPTVAGTQLQIGGGSGFIIDSSGLVVTNNHVVTGTGLQRVYIEGRPDYYNAHVLGASECSDLAVIQIDSEGETFPTLKWYQGDIATGLKVLAAGYPGGDPEFSLTDGIVSRVKVNGDTAWASVKSVFAHTAKILSGSSGGPLVTEDGQVVGINYSGVNETDQNFAIGRDGAAKIIETLQDKRDVSSIGINGVAVKGELAGQEVSGIWVRSVKSGSPADKTRLRPGDLITTMEGLPLGDDKTMGVYCDIIRERSTDTLTIKVLRSDGQAIHEFEGQINGRELAQGDTIAVVVAPTAASQPAPTSPPVIPAPAAPAPAGTHLGMRLIGNGGDPTCVSVQIIGIATGSWTFKANGIAVPAASFDSAGKALLCQLRSRRELTFNIYNDQGGVVAGGEGIPARGGDVFEGVWQ